MKREIPQLHRKRWTVVFLLMKMNDGCGKIREVCKRKEQGNEKITGLLKRL